MRCQFIPLLLVLLLLALQFYFAWRASRDAERWRKIAANWEVIASKQIALNQGGRDDG